MIQQLNTRILVPGAPLYCRAPSAHKGGHALLSRLTHTITVGGRAARNKSCASRARHALRTTCTVGPALATSCIAASRHRGCESAVCTRHWLAMKATGPWDSLRSSASACAAGARGRRLHERGTEGEHQQGQQGEADLQQADGEGGRTAAGQHERCITGCKSGAAAVAGCAGSVQLLEPRKVQHPSAGQLAPAGVRPGGAAAPSPGCAPLESGWGGRCSGVEGGCVWWLVGVACFCAGCSALYSPWRLAFRRQPLPCDRSAEPPSASGRWSRASARSRCEPRSIVLDGIRGCLWGLGASRRRGRLGVVAAAVLGGKPWLRGFLIPGWASAISVSFLCPSMACRLPASGRCALRGLALIAAAVLPLAPAAA